MCHVMKYLVGFVSRSQRVLKQHEFAQSVGDVHVQLMYYRVIFILRGGRIVL